MTAHAERVGVLLLLGLLMLVGWCAVALGVASDSGTNGSRTVGGVVSKRDGSTTIVIGGPFASAAIVVPDEPEPPARPAYAAETAAPDVPAPRDLPAVFGSVSLPDSSTLFDPSALLDASALPSEADLVGEVSPFDGSVVMEADQILADSAALEELWRLPAVTEEQRQTVGKQA